MAVATQAAYVSTGIMGIGFDTDESVSTTDGIVYANIVDEMFNQDLIKTRAYSLWLDDLEADLGTVLFGGYDSDKYSGDLAALDIQPDAQSGSITTMTVAWTSLSVTDDSGTTFITSDDFVSPTVLDSGTSLTVLPPDLYNSLANFAGAVNSQSYGALVQCNLSTYQGTLDYGFGGNGGPTISVPFSELVIPAADEQGKPLTFDDGSPACFFGLTPASEGEPILFGDTFLRSAYVVYDLDSQQIGIAPTVFNSTSSNVKEISSGNSTLEGASSIVSAATAKQTESTVSVEPGLIQTGTAGPIGTAAPKPSQGKISGVRTTTIATATQHRGTATAAGGNTATKTGQGVATASSKPGKSAAVRIPAFQPTAVVAIAVSFLVIFMGSMLFTIS